MENEEVSGYVRRITISPERRKQICVNAANVRWLKMRRNKTRVDSYRRSKRKRRR